MTLLQALFLGLLQGFTELFPISSSGHLAIAESIFHIGIPRDLLGFDVLLHAGSLCALLVCYPKKWWTLLLSPLRRDGKNVKLLLFLVLATIPGALAGFFLQDRIESMFGNRTFIALSFAITGMLLLLAERLPARRAIEEIGIVDALVIGIAQACALLPGLSRSGLTISTGRLRTLSRRAAVDFSFLMAVPIIAGAVMITVKNIVAGTVALPPVPITLTGFLASFIASTVAILCVLRLVRSHGLGWFALYLLPLSAMLLWWK